MAIDWKKFEQNNKIISLNILYVPHNKKEIGVVYKSKHNRKRENQVVLLMITNREENHYLALKSRPTADGHNRPIRGVISNLNGDFYCMGCLNSFRTDSMLVTIKIKKKNLNVIVKS